VNYAQQHLHMKIHRSHGRWWRCVFVSLCLCK
jgi:hypothetical protein